MEAPVLAAFSAVAVDHAAQVLGEGKLVVVPTDTVYGLAASLDRPEAVEEIYRVKRRPAERPIALLVDQLDEVAQVTAAVPPEAQRLMERFWPGGLTIVLPRRPGIPDVVTAGGPTVAVRMPDHPTPRAIVRRLGRPLPTTSANRHGQPSPKSAGEARDALGVDVALILDAGPAPGGIDSTVVDLSVHPPLVLRRGAIPTDALEQALGMKLGPEG